MPNLSVKPNQSVRLRVLLEDPDFLVVEKPARVATQPGRGHESDTILNGLFARYGAILQNLGKERDFGLLHRLDRDTSGLLLVGLRANAYDKLRTAFEDRKIAKRYWAIVAGRPRNDTGVIRKPIAEVLDEQKTAKIRPDGRPAVTAYRVVSQSRHATIVECRPATGRLHQIRVHMESIGCPVLGDALYAPPEVRRLAPRLALHAFYLAFKHPVTGAAVEASCPMPMDLRNTCRRLDLDLPKPPRPVATDANPDNS